MKVTQQILNQNHEANHSLLSKDRSFALVFCSRENLENPQWLLDIKKEYPNKEIVSVSTAGEIHNEGVSDSEIVWTDITLEKSSFKVLTFDLKNYPDATSLGEDIFPQLSNEDLKAVILFSDGHLINGENLINGASKNNTNGVKLVGGLAADGAKFEKTLVGLNDDIAEGKVVCIGLYGNDIDINCAYKGGWWQFGPIKKVTKSKDNVLFEINNEPALEVYKKYLGTESEGLPANALLYPLCIVDEDMEEQVVRTILSINEEDKSMTFAGNLPEGAQIKFMRANLDDLAQAACDASNELIEQTGVSDSPHGLTLAISCVGRKLVYNEHIEDEWMAIKRWLPESICAGYFSYGEISPAGLICLLHNQTITISHISEK